MSADKLTYEKIYDLIDKRLNRFEDEMGKRFEKVDSRVGVLEGFRLQVIGALIVVNIGWELLKERIFKV